MFHNYVVLTWVKVLSTVPPWQPRNRTVFPKRHRTCTSRWNWPFYSLIWSKSSILRFNFESGKISNNFPLVEVPYQKKRNTIWLRVIPIMTSIKTFDILPNILTSIKPHRLQLTLHKYSVRSTPNISFSSASEHPIFDARTAVRQASNSNPPGAAERPVDPSIFPGMFADYIL